MAFEEVIKIISDTGRLAQDLFNIISAEFCIRQAENFKSSGGQMADLGLHGSEVSIVFHAAVDLLDFCGGLR